jgi:hypothetical protein
MSDFFYETNALDDRYVMVDIGCPAPCGGIRMSECNEKRAKNGEKAGRKRA